jgi:hypothetical protein
MVIKLRAALDHLVGKDTNVREETIEDLIELAFVLLKSKNKNEKFGNYECAVTKAQVKW